ncbi:hypothetical protein MKJ04_20390 [Pontibacter sp. E15-1]|uniref:hypothetical protein n=1 Tax=Pontibacter sp. E15-1 TaxID=2919918 RepID=UPI001F4F32F8|nr:hypothetical protein [Pontibacter sp. E15-1]MCJ8167211.1 hypothetical protein [Pontibacter sp. E15-1]
MKNRNEEWAVSGRKNTTRLAIWTVAWTGSMALAAFGPKFIWSENVMLTVLAILLNAGLGIGMILANIRHMKGLDELQQKIQLEAMGIALGVGIVGGLSYSLLDTTNVISGDAEISVLVILISLTYLGGIIMGQIRYK